MPTADAESPDERIRSFSLQDRGPGWADENVRPEWQRLRNRGLFLPPIAVADMLSVVGPNPVCEGSLVRNRHDHAAWRAWRDRVRSDLRRVAGVPPGSRESEKVARMLVRSAALWVTNRLTREDRSVAITFDDALDDDVLAVRNDRPDGDVVGRARSLLVRALGSSSLPEDLTGVSWFGMLRRRGQPRPYDADAFASCALTDTPPEPPSAPVAGGPGTSLHRVPNAFPAGPFWRLTNSTLPDDLGQLVPLEFVLLGEPELWAWWIERATSGKLVRRIGRIERPGRSRPRVVLRVEVSDDPLWYRHPVPEAAGEGDIPAASMIRAVICEMVSLTAAIAERSGWDLVVEILFREDREGVHHVQYEGEDLDGLALRPAAVFSRFARDLPVLTRTSRSSGGRRAPLATVSGRVDLLLVVRLGTTFRGGPAAPVAAATRAAALEIDGDGSWSCNVGTHIGGVPVARRGPDDRRSPAREIAANAVARMLSDETSHETAPALEIMP